MLRFRRSRQAVLTVAAGAVFSVALGVPAGQAAHEGDGSGPGFPNDSAGRFACQPGHVPPAGFEDIGGNTHERQINCLARYGVTRGVTATQYAPGAPVPRDQVASFIARTLTELRVPLPAGEDRFRDVDGNVHEDAIERLAAAGVINGTGPDTYTPAATVTREQMATFLWRAFVFMRPDYSDRQSPDFFSDDDGTFHERNINRAYDIGLVAGKTRGEFDDEGRPYSHARGTYGPHETMTRAQMASFIARLLDAGIFYAPGSNLNPYPLGEEVLLRDDWSMSVEGSDNDATSEVLAHNSENQPPAEDHRYVIFRVRATNNGDEEAQFNGAERLMVRLPAQVGDFPAEPERGPQSAANNPCGDIPDPLPNPAVAPGGSVEGNLCFELSNSFYFSGLPHLFDSAWGNPAWPHFKAFPGEQTNENGAETSPYR